ncbi:MAG: ribosome assembly cofactor RimP, partial [Bacteroidales bacterium]|nr:ribosome assembly cofactor RimP [Bacteroidales bacterium]
DCFLVDVKVTRNNEIELTVESEHGTVTLDDCVALSRAFEEKFDRNVEDYELTVTSAGLDQPFKVLKQYLKAVGSQVEVSLRGGRRFRALLAAADENGVTIEYEAKETVDGSKKKVVVQRSEVVPYEQITGVRPYIEF